MLKDEIITGNGTPLWAMDYNDEEEESYDGNWLTPEELAELSELMKTLEDIEIDELEIKKIAIEEVVELEEIESEE